MRSSKASDRARGLIAFALCAAASAWYQIHAFGKLHGFFSDYRAFWCGGFVLAHGGDPYRAGAMLACERVAMPFHLFATQPGVAVPAPLPGYALALFVPFAWLPYPLAAALWAALLVAFTAGCVLLLARILNVSRVLCAWLLLLPAVMLWLPYGEIVPAALFGALFAALSLQRKRYAYAAAGLALSAIEPHIAVGMWIAVFLWEPKMRALLVGTGALLLLGWAIAGAGIVEYAAGMLPIHALAELPRTTQYSAAWIAHAAGLGARASLGIGTLTYAGMTILGVIASRRLARERNDPALLILLPMAAAVAGGTFVHAAQIAAAIPLALAVAVRSHDGAARWAVAALVALCIPWYQLLLEPVLIVIAVITAIAVVSLLLQSARWSIAAGVCAAALSLLLLNVQQHNAKIGIAQPAPAVFGQSDLASASWGRHLWKEDSAVTLSLLAAKLPTWLALLAVLAAATAYEATRVKSSYAESV